VSLPCYNEYTGVLELSLGMNYRTLRMDH